MNSKIAWNRLASTLASIALLALFGAPAAGQEPPTDTPAASLPNEGEVVAELTAGQRPQLRIAIPEFELLGGGIFDDAGRELEKTLSSDLEASSYFEIQGPWAFTALDLTGERDHDFEQYRSVNNEIILLGRILREGERMVFEGRVYELASRSAIVAKRYRGSPDIARRIAHTFADEVIEYLTGRRGVAMTTLAFTSDRDLAGRKEIYLMDYDGHGQRRLTAHKSTSMSASWRPDGKGVAYTSFYSGGPGLYYADARSGRKNPITTEGGLNISPTFSPDGRKVAFARSMGANIEVFTADRDGSNSRRLTQTGAIDTNPAWSPNGTAIAFTSGRGGSPQVYLMDTDGANIRRLTFEGSYNDNATWSPDGTQIAYSTRRGGRFQIAVTDVVTLETRVLTSGAGNHEDPTYSPDGRLIAYVRDVGRNKQIWVMNALTGGDARQLTTAGNNESPSWSPYPD